MKRVGVREFRDHATRYLAGDDVLAIERHGEPIGFYVPARTGRDESFARALARLEETVRRVTAETSLSEEELSRLFDVKQPLPAAPERRGRGAAADSHAAGR
jgi:hypothetical protein